MNDSHITPKRTRADDSQRFPMSDERLIHGRPFDNE
jgi:hypothetical protein